jgi:hypothetical protein
MLGVAETLVHASEVSDGLAAYRGVPVHLQFRPDGKVKEKGAMDLEVVEALVRPLVYYVP